MSKYRRWGILIVAVALVIGAAQLTKAQNARPGGERPADDKRSSAESKLYPDDIYDRADVMSPRDSFQYWLDTVTLSDEELKALLRKQPDANAGKTWTAEQLYEERVKRLEASFDFAAFFSESGEPLNDQLRERRKDELTRFFLGAVAREKYDQRNIKALSAPEAPDWDNHRAYVHLVMNDLVTGKDVTYRVDMKLHAKGLMWRWYRSAITEEKGPAAGGATGDDAHLRRIQDVEKRLGGVNGELAELDRKIDEIERRRAQLRGQRQMLDAEKSELERQRSPYAAPELTLRTAHKALREGNWEAFLAAHSKRVQETVNAAARKRFETSAGKEEVLGSPVVVERTPSPDDPARLMLKVEMRFRYRVKRTTDPETGETEYAPEEETRRVTLRFVREGERWLLDEDI